MLYNRFNGEIAQLVEHENLCHHIYLTTVLRRCTVTSLLMTWSLVRIQLSPPKYSFSPLSLKEIIKMNANKSLVCPQCSSVDVVVAAEQLFMVNTGEHYCHSAKAHDLFTKAACIRCQWSGHRRDLTVVDK